MPLDAGILTPGQREELVQTILETIEGQQHNLLYVKKLYAAPSKTFEGMIVLADGATWNPGAGAGFYGYRNGAWQFLG